MQAPSEGVRDETPGWCYGFGVVRSTGGVASSCDVQQVLVFQARLNWIGEWLQHAAPSRAAALARGTLATFHHQRRPGGVRQ